MNRRKFLFNSASVMAGGLLGLNSFSMAFGSEEKKRRALFQPRMALIIDDIGFSLCRTRQFLDLEVPITFAILPHLRNSNNLAFEIRDRGHEIILHQPMEPHNPRLDPGPGALFQGCDRENITAIIEDNIAGVPFAIGVNNHMGSRFTECRDEIYEFLKVINKKDLFFVDSLTSSESMAHKTAKKLHMPTATRNVFLDNIPEVPAILSQLQRLKTIALKFGHSIGIGHPHPETAIALNHFLPDIERSGVSLVHVSHVLSS